jgi:F-type H+-transporting ATPase subunit alpha
MGTIDCKKIKNGRTGNKSTRSSRLIEKGSDLVSLLEKSLQLQPQKEFEQIGIVVKVGDGVCLVHGLKEVVFGELIAFEGGNQGIVLSMDEDSVSIVLLHPAIPVSEQEVAKRTGDVFRVPVGDKLLGRVVSSDGRPLDGIGPLEGCRRMPLEKIADGIIYRTPVCQPLETGITVIDSLIPIGKGQRELLIGNRSTGKTSIALDAIIHQKGKNVVCVYTAIGNKQSNVARIIYLLEKYGALDYTIVVDANAQESALSRFLAPYTACTMAEHFLYQGKDVLIVYDDLSNHAIAYRELSLLLRRPPGREAYPGDIFYIHSRLLERACKLAPQYGGGSLTALPIAQTQGDDISAYIPTNLISITDGQIFLDTNLFNSGIRPAANIGLSVSRIGGAAQTKAIKKMAGSLKLDLAQYDELLAFAQFGSELDKISQRALDRGKRALELLKQPPFETYSFADQVLFLFLLKENYLDVMSLDKVKPFAVQFSSYVSQVYTSIYTRIVQTEDIQPEDIKELKNAANEFRLAYSRPE